MTDWIGLVESAYSLEGDLDVWLGRVLEAAESVLDQGGGLAGWIYSHAGDDWRIVTAGGRSSDPAFTELTQQTLAKTDLMNLHRLLLGSAAGGTLSSVPRSERPVERETLTTLSRNRFQDAFGLIAPTATGQGLVIGGPLPRRQKTSIADFNRHRRVAAHLGAGLRLRLALENSAGGGVEAVLDPNARLHHATGPARGSRAREFLRAAVEGRERARTRDQREDPDQALTIWEGLVAGRWSLVDRFESDGKRYVVARANDPELGDPRGLSRRERQVSEYVGMGRSFRDIAYLLGLCPSAISNAASRACTKLGLRGRVELARFFAPHGVRARLTAMALAGERLAAGAAPSLDNRPQASLTGAERQVTEDLLRGFTVAAIAERRASSTHTVSTQVKSIYGKLGVGSRLELVSRFAGADE